MFQKAYDFSADFMKKYSVPSMTFTRDDTNVNVFNINLVSNGTAINITGNTVELRFRKSDSTVVLGIATIIDAINGRITYKLGTNEIACVGNVLCGIMIYGQNGERASSYPFRFSVIDDMDDGYDETSETSYPILTQLISETTEIRNDYLELMNGGGSNHVHTNMTVLSALTDNNGTLNYNGQPIQGGGGTVSSIDWSNVTNKPSLSVVATSGSYTDLANRPTIPTPPSSLSQLSDDATHRLVTDIEKSTWNNKQNALSGDVIGHYHSSDRNWSNITNKPSIPTATSQLTNDSGFATQTYVDNRVSQVTGGSGGDMYRSTYDTDLDGVVDRAEVADSVQWANVQGRPTIPTSTSQLTNDSGFVTSAPTQLSQLTEDSTHRLVTDTEKTTWNNKANTTVATTTTSGLLSSADKTKLDGIATNANNYVHPSSHSSTMITGLATVATSGSYNDLTNRPTIPTNTSQLTNDSGFMTSTQVDQRIANANSSSVSITFYTNMVTPTSGTASIPIGISQYAIGDMLDVWMDGLYLYPTRHYSLNGGAIGLLDFTCDGTNEFFFKVTKASQVATPADTTAPNNVTNLTTSNITSTGLTLTWTASSSSDVASYDVYNGSTLLGNTTSTTYNVSGLTASTLYTFSVRARDNSGNVASGTTVNATTSTAAPTDTTTPNNVTNLATSNVTQTSLTLTWTASTSSDIASYDIYNGSTLLGNTANTTYNVTGLTAGTQYTFSVRARDTSNNVATGTTVTVTTTVASGGTQTGTVIASDSFTKANSTTTMGTTTEVGAKAWEYRGTWGINSNQAYMATMAGYDNYVCINAGVTSYKTSIKITNIGSWETGLVFRLQDYSNHWQVRAESNGYHLYRQQWGSPVQEGVYSCTPANGDVLSVINTPDTITVQLNGATIITVSSTVLNTYTKTGLYNFYNNNNGTIGRFDDFEVRTLS